MHLLSAIPVLFQNDVYDQYSGLPRLFTWPSSVNVDDYTYDATTGVGVLKLSVDGSHWELRTTKHASTQAKEIDLSWTLDYDLKGGDVFAVPHLRETTVVEGPGTIVDLYKTIGLGKVLVRRLNVIPTGELAPYLQAEIQAVVVALPATVTWPRTEKVSFYDHSDSSIGYYGATLYVDGVTWDLQLDSTSFGGADGRVAVTWKVSVDQLTGKVWAFPTYSGVSVLSGHKDLDKLCRDVGMGPRVIAELGMLVPLFDPNNADMAEVTNKLGANPALFRFVRVSDLEALHNTLRIAARL